MLFELFAADNMRVIGQIGIAADRAVRAAASRILGVSLDAQTLDKLNGAKRQLSLPAEFGGLNVPSLELTMLHSLRPSPT
jgi:hypothetical protein